MYKKISNDKFLRWLSEIKNRAQVIAPVKEESVWVYREWLSQDLPGNFRNSRLPPKGLFLDPLRPLFHWEAKAKSPRIHSSPDSTGPRVVWGVRACDARAARILEPVFSQNLADSFYLGNLARTVLLGNACQVQCPGSFCQEMGIDPQDSADCDIFFRDTSDGRIARVLTEKGKELVQGNDFFSESSGQEWESARGEVRGRRAAPLFDLEQVKGRVKERFSDEDLWQNVSAKCLNCGVCTYLCPTCHCFDLCDLEVSGRGTRFRSWDSCAFANFTQMPVHNPRGEKWRRYRQRIAHKFFFYPQNFQLTACVGCGRCVAHCPVNLDIREVLLEAAR